MLKRISVVIFAVFCFTLLLLPFHAAQASFTKNLWPMWLNNNPLSTQCIDHHLWAEFLRNHVVKSTEGINRLCYKNIRMEDKKKLEKYLQYLSTVEIARYNRREQLAYWLNFYNALTVKTVIDYYPIGSTKDINISPGLFSIGPWGAKLIEVQGQQLSLDDIHNKIIRPIWNDQRTHYAINNGALGAPNLQAEPFTGVCLEEQLNVAAIQYINSLRGVQMIEGSLVVSKLYKWFIDDFNGDEQGVIQHLKNFAKEPLKSQLKHVNSIDSYVYNWHLNSM